MEKDLHPAAVLDPALGSVGYNEDFFSFFNGSLE